MSRPWGQLRCLQQVDVCLGCLSAHLKPSHHLLCLHSVSFCVFSFKNQNLSDSQHTTSFELHIHTKHSSTHPTCFQNVHIGTLGRCDRLGCGLKHCTSSLTPPLSLTPTHSSHTVVCVSQCVNTGGSQRVSNLSPAYNIPPTTPTSM